MSNTVRSTYKWEKMNNGHGYVNEVIVSEVYHNWIETTKCQ